MIPFYTLNVLTPQGKVYSGEVTHARIPVENGSVGVLANHAAYVTSSAGGYLIIDEKGGQKKKFEVGSGFFSVASNRASFLTESFDSDEKTASPA